MKHQGTLLGYSCLFSASPTSTEAACCHREVAGFGDRGDLSFSDDNDRLLRSPDVRRSSAGLCGGRFARNDGFWRSTFLSKLTLLDVLCERVLILAPAEVAREATRRQELPDTVYIQKLIDDKRVAKALRLSFVTTPLMIVEMKKQKLISLDLAQAKLNRLEDYAWLSPDILAAAQILLKGGKI